jgi:hypothetical protein
MGVGLLVQGWGVFEGVLWGSWGGGGLVAGGFVLLLAACFMASLTSFAVVAHFGVGWSPVALSFD